MLTLPIKRKWFDMIASNIKKEEYRSLKPYWIKRLTPINEAIRERGTTVIQLRAGYALTSPTLLVGVDNLYLASPPFTEARHPEWGEPNEPHFIIPISRILCVCNIP